MSGASGLRKHGHTTDGDGGTISGGSSQFDDATLPRYRLPASFDYTQIAQPDPGDSSDSYVSLDGDAKLVVTPDGVAFGQIVAIQSNGNISLSSHTNGSVILAPAGTGRVSISGGEGLLLPRLALDPSSPNEGQIYYNTLSHTVRFYDGSAWGDL